MTMWSWSMRICLLLSLGRQNIFTDDVGIGRHTAIQTALRKNLVGLYPDYGSEDAPYFGGSVFRLSREIRQKFRGTDRRYRDGICSTLS